MAHKRANPLCVECQYPAQVTDHINPINMGGAVWDWNNLQSLCKPCHDAKSGRERHAKGGVGSNP